MDFKKIFTSKTGVAIVFVVITVLAVLGFSVICKRGGSYMFKDSRGEVREQTQVSEMEVKSSTLLVYDGQNVDGMYSVRDKMYHVVIEDNKIIVDDTEIFKVDDLLKKIYLIDDIFAVETFVNGNVKSNLFFVDMSGNVIGKKEGVINFKVNESDITYYLDGYVFDDNIIYESHSVDSVSYKYLGEYNFTNEYHTLVSSDILHNNVIYNSDGLKIEYIEKCNSEKSTDLYCYSESFIRVNGNDVEIAPVLVSVQKLYDGYLMVESCYLDGHAYVTYIIDQSGKLITDLNDAVGDNQFTAHPLISISDKSYADGYFYIYTVDSSSHEKYGTYFNGICEGYDVSDVLGRNYKFKYLGNGKVDKGTLIDEVTVNDYLKKYPQHCE